MTTQTISTHYTCTVVQAKSVKFYDSIDHPIHFTTSRQNCFHSTGEILARCPRCHLVVYVEIKFESPCWTVNAPLIKQHKCTENGGLENAGSENARPNLLQNP